METFIPEIQEKLRKAGYPRFGEALLQEILLGPGASAMPSQVRTKWTFANRDSTMTVVIAPDFILLETAKYETFEVFTEELRSVLALVGDVAHVELAERLGLRYLDYIRPATGDRVEDYLAAGLAGIDLHQVGVGDTRSVFVSYGTTAGGQAILRLTRSPSPFAMPPDLNPADVTIDPPAPDGEYALLDVDSASTITRDYSPDVIVDIFWELHDVIEGIFRAAVTPHALQTWRAEELTGGTR